MFAQNDENIFISIFLGDYAIMEKVATRIKKGESYCKVAKELRKQIADSPKNHGIMPTKGTKINPSKLEWFIYKSVDDKFYFLCSENVTKINY
jgi:hypothetical protein